MSRKKIGFSFKKKRFSVEAIECGFFRSAWGLMFSRRLNAEALLFSFDKSTSMAIHSYFVFFPFVAIWLNNKNSVVEIKTVRPFSGPTTPKKKYQKLVEIPLNNRYKKLAKSLISRR